MPLPHMTRQLPSTQIMTRHGPIRGAALNNLGQYAEALASCDKAIAIDPNNAITWNNRGVALNSLGQYAEALASYDKAIAIKPDYANAVNNRKIALQKLSPGQSTPTPIPPTLTQSGRPNAPQTSSWFEGSWFEGISSWFEGISSWFKGSWFGGIPNYPSSTSSTGGSSTSGSTESECVTGNYQVKIIYPGYSEGTITDDLDHIYQRDWGNGDPGSVVPYFPIKGTGDATYNINKWCYCLRINAGPQDYSSNNPNLNYCPDPSSASGS